jgi:hypothetical protein
MRFGNVWRKHNATVVFSHQRLRHRYEWHKPTAGRTEEMFYDAAQNLGKRCPKW